MDEQTLLVLRLLGYLLNIALLITVATKYRQHWLALGAWVLWLTVIATAVLLRYASYPEGYFQVIDWISTPLLYVNAAATAYVLLSSRGGNKP